MLSNCAYQHSRVRLACVRLAAINGAREAPEYFAAQCYLAGAYNKVDYALLQQMGVAQSEAERPDLVIEAYEKCVGTPS